MRLAALVVAGVAVAVIGQWQGSPATASPSATATTVPLEAPAPAEVLVFVSGAVAHPGLYRLSPTARDTDAVAMAGGLTADADLGRLPNLAARVHDGRQLNVPAKRTGARSGAAAAKLDINTATLDELRAVPGMPVGLADAIVDHRGLWGPVLRMSELRTLFGVDAATVSALGSSLRVVLP